MPTDAIVVGKIGAPFGVRGWVSINSFTEPAANILNYQAHLLIADQGSWIPLQITDHKLQHKKIVAQINNCDDRDAAALLTGKEIAVEKQHLPQSDADSTYWHDLIGCTVINLQGAELGTVDHLFETGANDVLVLHGARERLVPFTAITDTDFANKTITVDWDVDF